LPIDRGARSIATTMSLWVTSHAPTLIYFAVTCGLALVTLLVRFIRHLSEDEAKPAEATGGGIIAEGEKNSREPLGRWAKFAPLVYCAFVFALVGLVRLAFDPPRGLCDSFEGYTKTDIYAHTPDPRIEGDVVDTALTKAMDAERAERRTGWEARAALLAGEQKGRRQAVEASIHALNCGNYVEWEALVGLESAIGLSIWFGAVWFWKDFSTREFWHRPKRAPLAYGVAVLCIGLGWGAAYCFLDEASWRAVLKLTVGLRVEQVARCLLGFTLSAGGVLLFAAFGLQVESQTVAEELEPRAAGTAAVSEHTAANTQAPQTDPKFWAQRMRKLQIVLYAGAALLTAMILENSSIIRWALPPSGPGVANHASAHGLVLVRGIVATFLLVGIYVPAHLNIARKMVHVAQSVPGARRRLEMSLTLPRQVLRLVYLLAPLLTGQLSEVFSKIQEAIK
jgi:hypothetical protein